MKSLDSLPIGFYANKTSSLEPKEDEEEEEKKSLPFCRNNFFILSSRHHTKFDSCVDWFKVSVRHENVHIVHVTRNVFEGKRTKQGQANDHH